MNLKSDKAITLVALIITIIILLILAGVSLSMVLGDNGLINKAQSSVDKYQQSANNEQIILNSIEEYIDLNIPKVVTAKEIESNPKKYYGARVINYDKGASYRIFYVDTAGKYGDGEDTVYLIADYDDNRVQALGFMDASSVLVANSYDATKTKIREMNPIWAENRGASSWVPNERAVAYLCDTSKWMRYCDETKANYVIGSPSLEMYVDSYNKTHSSNSLIYKYKTDIYSGYDIECSPNSIDNAIDISQNGIYMVSGKNCWISSPCYKGSGRVFNQGGQGIYNNSGSNTFGVRPVVSLKSNATIEINLAY